MNKIEIYTSQTCPYCVKAKKLLKTLGLEYMEFDVSGSFDKMVENLEKRFGIKVMTIPQIIINDKHIGGFDDLNALYRSGELKKYLVNE